jgi:protease-4
MPMLALLVSGCVIKLPLMPRSGDLRQQVIRPGDRGKGKLLLIDVSGVIGMAASPSLFGTGLDLQTLITESLDLAQEDDRIKAVVLRIDSPGGTVTGSDILYQRLRQFREARPEVTIYASLMGLAASGGYYVAMAADEVSAHPTTITGSIGVIAQFPLIRTLTDRFGIELRTIKSGANKDMGSLFEPFTEEQRTILQQSIDTLHDRFVEVVKAGRPKLDEEAIRALADGRIYTSQAALEAGLIDRIEYLPDLIKRLEKKAGGKMTIVSYDPLFSPGSSVYATRSSQPAAAASQQGSATVPGVIEMRHSFAGMPRSLEPGFHYLWIE